MGDLVARIIFRLPQQPRDCARNLRYLLRQDKSQYGEQQLLASALPLRGTYLEIGAYQPVILSNTWRLSKQGWRGWSVDANGSFRTQWRMFRPGSTFIHAAVVPQETEGEATLHHDSTGVGNTSSLVASHLKRHVDDVEHLVRTERVPAIGIGKLLGDFSRAFGAAPDLLHIDCEGLDAELVYAMIDRVSPELWPAHLLVEQLDSETFVDRGIVSYREVGRAGSSVLLAHEGSP